MVTDLKTFLWILKLGTLLNLYFLLKTLFPPLVFADKHILIPAQILFIVCAYRCLFPVRYTNNIVFHDLPISSIFLTRFFATFSEVASIYLLAYLIRLLNINQVPLVDVLSWLMIVQVCVSQCFVWGGILTGRLILYVYEELGWGIIFIINTMVSAYLYATIENFSGHQLLIHLHLLFGIVYLPWQLVHLNALRLDAQKKEKHVDSKEWITWSILVMGLYQSIQIKNQSSQLQDWGGLVGIIWATAYWATVMPVWVYLIITIA